MNGGVKPEINYAYTQLQAQVMGTGGVLVNSDEPQWRVTEVRRCNIAANCRGTANETTTTTTITITYSPANNVNVASATTAAGDGLISSTNSYAYDFRDNLLSIDGPLPGTSDTTYIVNDLLDRRVGVIGSDPDNAGPRLRVGERYAFDSASRVIKVERRTVTGTDAAPLAAMLVQQSLDVVYDANGNRIRGTASSGSTVFNVVCPPNCMFRTRPSILPERPHRPLLRAAVSSPVTGVPRGMTVTPSAAQGFDWA